MQVQSISRNTVLLTGALVAQKILSFGYFWYLSSQLDKSQLGVYVFALSFATLFGSGNDLGLTPILIRESARDPKIANRYLQNVMGCKLLLASGSLALTMGVVTVSGRPVDVWYLVFLACWFVFLDAFTVSLWGMFKAARNLKYESFATVVVQLVILSSGMLVLTTSRSLLHLVATLVLASAVNLALAAWLLKRVLRFRLRPRWDFTVIRQLARLVPAFALSLVFVKIYNVADTVLLGYLVDSAAVANYAIPAKVVTSLQQIIPATFAAVIFPVFTQQYRIGKAPLSRMFERACSYLITIGVPASAALVLLAPKILWAVWPAYVEATAAFRIMALALPFVFLAFPTGYLLNACDQQRRNTIHRGFVLAANLLGNLLLIPQLGFYGSAIMFTASNVLLLVLDLFGVLPLLQLRRKYLFVLTIKVMLASALMVTIAHLLSAWLHLAAVVVIAGLTYVVAVFILNLPVWRDKISAPGADGTYA